MNDKRLKYAMFTAIVIVAMCLLAWPAVAFCPPLQCGDHHTGACNPGYTCQVTGQDNCVENYGPCQLCPSHQVQVCTDTCDHTYCDENGHSCSPHAGYCSDSRYTSEGSCTAHHRTWYPAVTCPYQHGACIEYTTQTVYDCHSQGYARCDGLNHEKQDLHTQTCQNTFGCVATSCPAIPCGEHQTCVEGTCVNQPYCGDGICNNDETVFTCPQDCGSPQCGTDFCTDSEHHCVENECVPNSCGDGICQLGENCPNDCGCDAGLTNCDNSCVNLQTDGSNCGQCGTICGQGRYCGGGICHSTDSYTPFTTPECRDMLMEAFPLNGMDLIHTPMLSNMHDAAVRATVSYVSRYDCAIMACYTMGGETFSQDCSNVEYYNLAQVKDIQYGGGILHLNINTPVVACRLLVVKHSPETALPVSVVIKDSHDTVGAAFTSTDQVTAYNFTLPNDFSSCRPLSPLAEFLPQLPHNQH